MYKCADEHLTTLTENLHKVIGDACKTYTEDAIIRFKQEVYQLFDVEVGADPVPTTGHEGVDKFPDGIFVTPQHLLQNKSAQRTGPYSTGQIPKLGNGEKVLTIGIINYDRGSYDFINGSERRVITTLGNLYWYKYTVQMNGYAYIESGEHITNTPLSPLFATVIKNANDSKNVVNLLDMNRKYYYLLAKDAGGEIVRKEKELAQKAAAGVELAAEFEAKYNTEYEKRRAAEAELAAMREKVRAIVG